MIIRKAKVLETEEIKELVDSFKEMDVIKETFQKENSNNRRQSSHNGKKNEGNIS